MAFAPGYNEAGKIGNVVRRCKPFVDEVVIVDDGSRDRTADEARKAGATVIRFGKNRGVGAAYREAFYYGLKKGYDIFIVMGGDDQDSAEDIPLFLAAHARGFQFVQGSRYMPGGKTDAMPLARLLMTKAFTWFINLMTGAKLSDGSNGFRGIDLRMLRKHMKTGYINLDQDWLDRYCLEIYLMYKLLTAPVKYTQLPVTKTFHRKKGYTKMRVIVDWWQVLKPLILLRLGLKK
jgi:dolichol-phosphate mannosyltransferase